MCFWAEVTYKQHHVCVRCRLSFKRHVTRRAQPCPRCGAGLVRAGHDFAPPPRRDRRAWSVVSVVLAAGLSYEGRDGCGCGREPKYRPRTRAALRARRRVAAREGAPLARVLARPDPLTPVDGA
ncbi:hypothetical protein [Streptomyces sp. NPDC047046]|uniref:hypothetical protein n=1 Tax=Streptomyces sp. NPDC047046 TaxID=3155378 RepID=UPI0033CD3FC0